MEPGELIAREQIRDLIARYNAFGDSGRLDEMMQLFTPDATLELAGRSHRGIEAIRALFGGAAESTRSRPGAHLRHFTATHQIELRDTGAGRGRCYFLVLTENGLDHWGRYIDTYRRSDAVWLFETRRVTIDGRTPGGWADEQGFG